MLLTQRLSECSAGVLDFTPASVAVVCYPGGSSNVCGTSPLSTSTPARNVPHRQQAPAMVIATTKLRQLERSGCRRIRLKPNRATSDGAAEAEDGRP